MSRFAGLEGPSLHDAVLEIRRRHAQGEFELIQALMAVEAAGLHRQMGCGTVVDYGSRHLNLDPQKASELLRVGRLLPQYPLLAKVIEEGRLHWSKIREITRVMTPGNEERLVEYAKAHTSPQVQRLVVCRPRQASQVATTAAAATTASTGPRPAAAPLQQDLFEEVPAPAPPAPAEEPPVRPSEILYEVRLSGSQYAKQEQAANRIRSRLGYHAGRAKVQEEMCDIVLSVGEVRTRIRYQVYLHVDGLTGEGWLDTDRGFLPAPSEVVKQALATGRVKQVHKVPGPVGNSRAWSRASHSVCPTPASRFAETLRIEPTPAPATGAAPSPPRRSEAASIANSPSPAAPPGAVAAAQPPAVPPEAVAAAQPPAAGPGAVAAAQPPAAGPSAVAAAQPPAAPPGAVAAAQPPAAPPGAVAASQPPAAGPSAVAAAQPPAVPPEAVAAAQPPAAPPGAVANSLAQAPTDASAPASDGPPMAGAGLSTPEPGRVEAPALHTGSPDDSPLSDAEAASPSARQRRHPKARRKIPIQVLRELMEDSEGRCVDCGRRTRVQFNHRDEPYSECPQHDPSRMDSRCDSCHAVFHEDDFRLRPGWKAARDRAIARRRQQHGESAPTGNDST